MARSLSGGRSAKPPVAPDGQPAPATTIQMSMVDDRRDWLNGSALSADLRRSEDMLEEDSQPGGLQWRRGTAAAGAARRRLGGCGLAAGRGAAAQRGGDRHLPRPPRPRHAPDLRDLGQPRAPGAPSRPSELLRVPCDLDLADAEDREEAEQPLRRAGHRAARRAGRRRHGARACGASRWESWPGAAWPSTTRSSSRCACPPTGCCPPRWWPPSPSSSSRRCAAPGRWPTAARRWGSPASSRT